MKSFTRIATTSALAVALALPAAAQNENQDANQQNAGNQNAAAQQNASDQKSSNQNDSEEKASEQQTRQLQIFELKHIDPQHVQQIITLHDGIAQPALNRGAIGRRSAFRPGAQAGRGGAEDADTVTMSVAPEEKLLFVRGPSDQLEEIKKLVTAVDVESGNLQPIDYAKHRLLPVSSDKATRVQQTLAQLNLNCQILRFGETTLVALRTDEENSQESKQAEQVIQKLSGQDKEKSKEQAKEKKQQDSTSDKSNQADSANNQQAKSAGNNGS